jgi:hypothetical protein
LKRTPSAEGKAWEFEERDGKKTKSATGEEVNHYFDY